MDIKKLNNKRKLLCLLSVLGTVFSILLFIFLEIVFAYSKGLIRIIGMLLTFILFLAILYYYSKLLIIPQYEKLKKNIIEYTFKNKYQNCKIKSKKHDRLIEYFYNKNDLDIKNSITFEKDENILNIYDFQLSKHKSIRKSEVVLAGKWIKIKNINIKLNDAIYILANKQDSQKFIDFYRDDFKNINDNLTIGKKYKRYVCLYNDKFNFDILNLIEDIGDFQVIIVKDNVVDIMFHEAIESFEFKLSKPIPDDCVARVKLCYGSTFKVISKVSLLMEEK